MKIKLVTFAPHPNFGTCLQSYALNKVLRDLGHDVDFLYNGREEKPLGVVGRIRTMIKHILPKEIVYKIKTKKNSKNQKLSNQDVAPNIIDLPNNYLHYYISKLPFYNWLYKKYKYRSRQWKKVYKFAFEDGNYIMKRLYTKRQYDEQVKDADLFITGSDQIWNPYCGGFNPMMFLEFAGEKKRIAYSSSISRTSIPDAIKQRMIDDLKKFSYIGVREQSSVDLLNTMLGRNDVRAVLDPTYLLSQSEWTDFSKKANIEFELPEKYIFCYFVGDKRIEEYNKMIDDVKEFTGIDEVITLECYDRPINYGGGRLYYDAGPYEWVYLLANSAYVCMDSFHATVFAMKFQKDFVHVLKNKPSDFESQNSRMIDLLNRYGLSNKIYNAGSKDWQNKIDYERVSSAIEKDVKDSMDFLKSELI